jgi:hypothetical protein
MSTITEGLVVSDVVKKELPDRLSRETEVVAASQTLLLGAVVQKNSSDQILALAAEADEVQTVAITGTIASGEFVIAFIDLDGNRIETDAIAWNADTAAIQAGVDTALGGSMVTVGGTGTVASHTLTFGGTGYTELAQTLAEYDVSQLEDSEDVTVTRTTAGGTGGNDAYGVILEAVTTGGGETQAVACITNNAELNSSNLSYGSGDSDLANAALNAKNIKTTAQVS